MPNAWRRPLHVAACLSTSALVGWLVFSDVADGWAEPYCLLLPLAWAALAFDRRTTVAALAITVYAAAVGSNPYARAIDGPLKRELILLLALLTAGSFGLTLATIAGASRRDHAALVQLNAELEDRIKAAVALSEKALTRAKRAKRLRALGQVAGGVAHEFNNILQAATGALEMIIRRPTDTERVLYMATIALDAVERGAVITRRLLAFARRAPLHAASVDVVEVLTALREPLARMVGEQIAVTLTFEDALPAALVDKTELETAVINLAANARDAMQAGGTLAIAATAVVINGIGHPRATLGPGRYVCIAVGDNGTGMDAAILARAEEPFFTTKRIGFGTGLGLSMAKGFAEQSGGGLAVESALGVGTTITLWLPIG